MLKTFIIMGVGVVIGLLPGLYLYGQETVRHAATAKQLDTLLDQYTNHLWEDQRRMTAEIEREKWLADKMGVLKDLCTQGRDTLEVHQIPAIR